MNAHALLKYIWPDEPEKKEFPPEAYSYDSPIEKEKIAALQKEADKILEKKKWVTIERLGDGHQR